MLQDGHPEILAQEEQQGVISDDFISSIKAALRKNRRAQVNKLIAPLLPADVGHLIERLSPELRQHFFQYIKQDFDPEVLLNVSPAVLGSMVELIGISRLAVLLPELDSDDAFAILEELDEQQQQALLAVVPKENRMSFEKLMTYPEDSAARISQQEVVIVPSFWTVAAVINYIQRSDALPEEFYEIYVVNPKHAPIGKVSLNQLIRFKPDKIVQDIMETEVQVINAFMKQDDVAYAFRHYDLVSAPVVDEADRIIGMITADDVIDVIDEEAQKEIMQLSGVDNSDVNAPILITSYHRMAGLLVTFVNSFILAVIVYHYEALIAEKVALVALMPIVAGMSGASGTQVIAVTVRSIATKMMSPANTWRTVLKEATVGCINGCVFALVLMLILMLWYADWALGLILMIALIFNMTWAAITGVTLPLLVDRLGLDPAISSGPMLTATTDVIGFITLLALASMFL